MRRRTTQHKKKILEVFEGNHLLSAAELAEVVPDANESTIYRNLKRLESDGVIGSLQVSGEKKYELVSKHGDHDHFVCNTCDKIKAVYLDDSYLQDELPTSGNFSVTVRGICNDCD